MSRTMKSTAAPATAATSGNAWGGAPAKLASELPPLKMPKPAAQPLRTKAGQSAPVTGAAKNLGAHLKWPSSGEIVTNHHRGAKR